MVKDELIIKKCKHVSKVRNTERNSYIFCDLHLLAFLIAYHSNVRTLNIKLELA